MTHLPLSTYIYLLRYYFIKIISSTSTNPSSPQSSPSLSLLNRQARSASSQSGQPLQQSSPLPLPYPPGRRGSGVGGINDDHASDRGGEAVRDAANTADGGSRSSGKGNGAGSSGKGDSSGGGGGGITAAGIAIGSWLASRGTSVTPPPVPSTATAASDSPPGQGLGPASESFQMSTPQRPSPSHHNATSPYRDSPSSSMSMGTTPTMGTMGTMGATPTSRTGAGLGQTHSTRSLAPGLSSPAPGGGVGVGLGVGLSFHHPRTPDSSGHNSQMPLHYSNRSHDNSPLGGGVASRSNRERSISNLPSLLFSSMVHYPPTTLSPTRSIPHDMPMSHHDMNTSQPNHHRNGATLPMSRSHSSTPPSPGTGLAGQPQPIGPEALLTALSLSMADDAESLAMVV